MDKNRRKFKEIDENRKKLTKIESNRQKSKKSKEIDNNQPKKIDSNR